MSKDGVRELFALSIFGMNQHRRKTLSQPFQRFNAISAFTSESSFLYNNWVVEWGCLGSSKPWAKIGAAFVILHATIETMAASLQHWRKHNGLTQVDAAALLGVSQPYLSLLERGSRPLTKALRNRMNAVRKPTHQDSTADHFRRQMSALGYPLFAHVSPARAKPSPDALLLSVLSQPDVDSRVVEALPWLVRQYAGEMELPWLVRQAKLQSLQNRMGFLFQAAGVETSELMAAAHELERARLLEESTLCWDTMPAATREWVRANRSPLAKHWNVVTTLQPRDSHHAG